MTRGAGIKEAVVPTSGAAFSFLKACYNTRMNKPLKITKIGNSAGIVLPKDVLARLRVGPGDALYLSEAPDGVRLTAIDPDFSAKMQAAEEIMREDRDILRELAK